MAFEAVILRHQFFSGDYIRLKLDRDKMSFYAALGIALNMDSTQKASSSVTFNETAQMMRTWLLRNEEWQIYRQHILATRGESVPLYECILHQTPTPDVINFVSRRLNLSVVLIEPDQGDPTRLVIQDTLPTSTTVVLMCRTAANSTAAFEPILLRDTSAQTSDIDNDPILRSLRSSLSKAFSGVAPNASMRAKHVLDSLSAPFRGVFARSEPVVRRVLAKLT
tara:strand:- start:611 stop:1279 length:669 start_codon:yes stop_codon:yes gene_type:complete